LGRTPSTALDHRVFLVDPWNRPTIVRPAVLRRLTQAVELALLPPRDTWKQNSSHKAIDLSSNHDATPMPRSVGGCTSTPRVAATL